MPRILLVDDDLDSLHSTKRILDMAGFEVITALDGSIALEMLKKEYRDKMDAVVTDVRMPKLSGLEFLKAVKWQAPELPIVLMTAYGRVDDAVWAMKEGAVDFLIKPFKRADLLKAVGSALARGKSTRGSQVCDELVGNSRALSELKNLVKKVAPTSANVLILGESGSGKERLARLLHQLAISSSGPSGGDKPFVAINCAAVPETLLESELFGYEKGAFTGAEHSKPGLFEQADGGILMLDEIGDLPLSVQPKLLRVLQESEVRRLGGVKSKKVNVRVVAATHRPLHEWVKQGKFREDLLYRLDVITLNIPPFRDRMEDLPDLVATFLEDAGKRHGKPVSGLSQEVFQILARHRWPGNIRELQNVIERAVVMCEGRVIEVGDLPPHLLDASLLNQVAATQGSSVSVTLGTPLKDVEDLLIKKTLEATSGDKEMTARLLGINSRTIYRRLQTQKAD